VWVVDVLDRLRIDALGIPKQSMVQAEHGLRDQEYLSRCQLEITHKYSDSGRICRNFWRQPNRNCRKQEAACVLQPPQPTYFLIAPGHLLLSIFKVRAGGGMLQKPNCVTCDGLALLSILNFSVAQLALRS
jgi:hypothetical protein